MGSVLVDVEEGENCSYSMQLVFSTVDEARRVRQVRLYHESDAGRFYDVAAWHNEDEPSPALGVAVEDSGEGRAYLIYGGNGGLRIRPAESNHPWDLDAPDQWGRSHMLLANPQDIVWEQSDIQR